jgi:L-alanine-DL-glutamate epimerase-like enolase superfamily enzyme
MTPTATAVSRIAAVEVIALRAPSTGDALDAAASTLLVRITDEAGRVGIGETDTAVEPARAFLEMPDAHAWSRSPVALLIGEDPFELGALHDRLHEATAWPGRRGVAVHALSAVDIALHDLVGHQLGRPVWQLLGGARRERLTPYATVYAGDAEGRRLSDLEHASLRLVDVALEEGFRAVKLEVLFGDLATDRDLVRVIGDVRRHIGEGVSLLVDFGYRWREWRDALAVLERIAEHDVWLAEATVPHDDLAAHARLADRSPVRIGGGELAATRHEARAFLDDGRVDVLQCDLTRCGGFVEGARIAALAQAAGASFVPHGWHTGITAAVGRHFQAATAACPWFEHLSPRLWPSVLRRHLVTPEPTVVDGTVALPDAPGLGVELDEDVVRRFRT